MRQFEMRRRIFLGGLLLATVSGGRSTAAAPVVGKAAKIRGNVRRRQGGDEERLAIGGAVLDKDYVLTSSNSFADLALSETRILLGPQTELLIDSYIAGQGGTLELGLGRMVFDRPEGLPKTDVAVRTAFGMIGVRGTKFFCGPSRAASRCSWNMAWCPFRAAALHGQSPPARAWISTARVLHPANRRAGARRGFARPMRASG